jgi:hypothetical protein
MEAVFAAPARHPDTMSLLIPSDVVEWVCFTLLSAIDRAD